MKKLKIRFQHSAYAEYFDKDKWLHPPRVTVCEVSLVGEKSIDILGRGVAVSEENFCKAKNRYRALDVATQYLSKGERGRIFKHYEDSITKSRFKLKQLKKEKIEIILNGKQDHKEQVEAC